MTAIELRPLQPAHSASARELILRILNVEYGMALTLAELPDIVDLHRTYVASGAGAFWVALAGEAIVGCIGVLHLEGTDYEVRRMYVDPEYRGRGIAQRLLDRLMAWCGAHDVGALYLETNVQWRAAQHLYAKRGFTPIERDALPRAFPVVRIATGFWRLVLNPSPIPPLADESAAQA